MIAPVIRTLNRVGLVCMFLFALFFAGVLGRLGAPDSAKSKANIAAAQRVLETERAYLLVRATELDAREKRLASREERLAVRERSLVEREKRFLDLQAISSSERADLEELDRLLNEAIKMVESRKVR